MNSQSERTDEEVVGRLIRWCDLHGIVVGSSLYYAAKLLILAERKKALSDESEIIKKLKTRLEAAERVEMALRYWLDRHPESDIGRGALSEWEKEKEKQNADPKS